MLAVYLEETIGVGNFENTPFAPVRGKNLGPLRIDAHSGHLYHALWVAENVHRYHSPDSGKRPRSQLFKRNFSRNDFRKHWIYNRFYHGVRRKCSKTLSKQDMGTAENEKQDIVNQKKRQNS